MEQIPLENNNQEIQTNRKTGNFLEVVKRNISLRMVVQIFVTAILVVAAVQFYGFYQDVQNFTDNNTTRPPVAEGFLPIAAIVAFKAMFITGQIDPIHPAGLVIFLVILLTAWIFRRSLCSWICPLGTLSEYLGKLGKKVMGRNFNIPKWLDFIFLALKYVLFFYIIKQFLLLPSEYAVQFMQLPYYTISDVKMFELFLNLSIKGFAIIGVLMALSFLFKNFWCRYLCPYGALTGLLGIVSPIILKKNNETCISCGLCNKACPSKVNVQDKKHVVLTTECTGCTSCVSVCPKPNTLQFKLLGVIPVKPVIFSIGFIAVFFGLILVAKLTGNWESLATLSDYQSIYNAGGGF